MSIKIKKIANRKKRMMEKAKVVKPLRRIKKPSKTQAVLLRDVVSYVSGPTSMEIVGLLHGRENVNEFLIAKKMDMTINQARNILYKLADEGLVNFIRKKDKKNGGWYTYFWTLDVGKALSTLKNKILNQIENLERQLNSKQTKQFYYCQNCDVEMTEESALLCDFTCPECGEVFVVKDNTNYIKEIKTYISELKNRLELVNVELVELSKKEEASKNRKKKLDLKKKKIEREIKRKAREAEKKRLNEKSSKKKPKKNIIKKKKKMKKYKKVKKNTKFIKKKKKIAKKKTVKNKLGRIINLRKTPKSKNIRVRKSGKYTRNSRRPK